ncbi:hypothetical protein C4577_02030 [Candidatus Parcubacteria bacterium]|nr:MAG: hypothetical protein C4577_02030 [Candidatus Parcubacteria bacterium]
MYLFIGERPSNKALQMGVNWEDGRLAAKQLFDALLANGIDPTQQVFINWFKHLDGPFVAKRGIKSTIGRIKNVGYQPVALGRRVSKAMTEAQIDHLFMIHPAARGKIRKKSRYIKHVRKVLNGTRS